MMNKTLTFTVLLCFALFPHALVPYVLCVNDAKTYQATINDYWHGNISVVVKITTANNTRYSEGVLYYRIIATDVNHVIKDWNKGRKVVLKTDGCTTFMITEVVPLRRNLQPDRFKVEAKLVVLSMETLRAESMFTVEKVHVQIFLRDTVVLTLCILLVGLAYNFYRHREKPWDHYPQPRTT